MLGKSNRKLKNILINPSYQLRYTFWVTATGGLLVLINSLIFYLFVRENYSTLVDLGPMSPEAKLQLYQELNEIILYLGVLSVLFLVVVSVFGVLMSHRTAGPMFHFKKVFAAIAGGDLSARVKLRPKDDFQDVADSFNEMIDKLSARK